MSATFLTAVLAVLPVALAVPHPQPGYCDEPGGRPCPRPWWKDDSEKTTSTTSTTATVPLGTGMMTILPVTTSSTSSVFVPQQKGVVTTDVLTNPIRTTGATTVQPTSTITSAQGPASSGQGASSASNVGSGDDTVRSQFASSTTYDFASGAAASALHVATDAVDETPLSHTFATANVFVEDGFLVLNVPGGQEGTQDVSAAEVSTNFDMKYGSVRTWAILTEVAGVCNGMFLWKSDEQETDIEWISDASSDSNAFANNGTRAMQYTNQDLEGVRENASQKFGMAPDDATSAVHEYRTDWTAESTKFYIDGVLQQTISDNVPTEGGPWVWNNWSDGDQAWAKGPPATDAQFKIQKIEIYYDPA